MKKYGMVLFVFSWNSYGIETCIALEKNLALISDSFSKPLSLQPIENVPVLYQGDGSSACGYHALKNGLYYVSYLDGNLDALPKMQEQTIFNNFQSEFIALCNADQPGKPCEVNKPLDNGSLIRTLESHTKKLSNMFSDIQLYFYPQFITVLSDYPQWYLMEAAAIDLFLKTVDSMKKDSVYKHVFLLGVDPSKNMGNTHWIAVVVYKQDGMYFYRLLDSLGKDRRSDGHVTFFMSLLQQSTSNIRQSIEKNISDAFKISLQDLLHIFQTTGAGALAMQNELVRFVQLYSMLQGKESKFPQWMMQFQETCIDWCSEFLGGDGRMYKKLSPTAKSAVKKNKKDIESLKKYLESDEFLQRLPALEEE